MFVDRDPEAQRGHDNHKAWIMKNQHKGDDKEEIEDKMDDDNDDGDNDDAMGEGKKRKFQQWLTMMSTMKFIKVTMMENLQCWQQGPRQPNTAQRADNEDCWFHNVEMDYNAWKLLYS